MINQDIHKNTYNQRNIKWLTYLMFMMFAMTTDAVGVIIPEVMGKFNLSMTAAGLLHYGPMTAIALAGIFLGFLADKLGRKKTIVIGLTIFVISSYLFLIGNTFGFFLLLLIISGVAIGIFKTGALALIGDMSRSTNEHTSTMNIVEGFFGVGAIIGPFLVSYFLSQNVDWKWLYIVAATLCVVLIIMALLAKYPETKKTTEEPINVKRTLKMVKDPYALGFSMGAFLYVSIEAAIYVWMPTLIADYDGSFMFIAIYALPIFFILRAGGRFFGAWLLANLNWTVVLTISSLLIFLCYAFSFLNDTATVILLPLSGLFMSVIYPTINSKGISCFPKSSHGSVAGIILFFTSAGAAIGPLLMGVISDLFDSQAKYGFIFATVLAGLLFIGFLLNMIFKPTKKRLELLNKSEY
ncbi:sugar MFS transporter [Lutibacter sp. B1]|uniref:MFS transporter n=1 Tax=Lutibacter sp. B1 TaxID=2725996 RepID=UPI001457500D|nr:MFS transporter [Lutibacter sp. B1]NLP57846.1 MFS transporter [Lutibacter sp. B1]